MHKHIFDLIIAYASGHCTVVQKQELEHWVNQSEENRKQFKDYLRLCNSLGDIQNLTPRKQSIIRRIRSQRWLQTGIAAGLLLSLWFGYRQFIGIQNPDHTVQVSTRAASTTIRPGETKAYLQIGDQRIAMDQHNSLAWSDELTVLNQEGESVYHSDVRQAPPHTIVVPRGSEFDFTLADGTHVWLNSESSITFPAQFESTKRNIKIHGEVYLEVAKDKIRPFTVSLSQGNVQVLGTRFYLNDRTNEDLYTVLVEGSIAYEDSKTQKHLLRPGHKLTLQRDNGKISIRPTDTNLYTSWIKKIYVFDNQRLGDIMTTLSRWYDFEFEFEDESLQDTRFSGRLKRNQSLTNLLKSYEEISDIRFKIQGKHIYIQKSPK